MGQQQWISGGEQPASNLAKTQRDTTDLGALSRSVAAKKQPLPSRPIGKPIGLVKGGRSMSKG